ncbi:30S ribosomal protein S17 [candidate division WOR-3 bacterium]|uniref:Small ribosomal subunit protein uS17 n=1 Tax=candidate division WOR-3 bacterium TaxID=2052148 RepID=A0A9D5K7P4_UNCW3|nr:30S ribosomal protein S17 [candidate division WOR-3 bacterium]MBD3363803.1 30S ribosomal protein S17 [candidate division WOR-3 bacterium]
MSSSKRLVGLVVSDRPDKTVVVSVIRKVLHRRYKKYVNRRHKYYVHDAENRCKVGDRVEIEETRPVSKLKHFRLVKVLGDKQ